MKKNFATILFISALTISITGCKDKAKEATTKAAETVEVVKKSTNSNGYVVNTSASVIEWKGFKPGGSHNGTMSIKSGLLDVIDGKIVGGAFVIDMNSIAVTDIPVEEKGNAKLLGHLKNADFFDVAKHPTAGFTITNLENTGGKMMLSGNLSLKGVENNVTFPVSVVNDNGSIVLTSETFTIDRTKWKIEYKSKSIFKSIGDKFINDDIELKVVIKAAANS